MIIVPRYHYYHRYFRFRYHYTIIVIVNVYTIVQNTACPLQATRQVFALVPIGSLSQEHGRQRGHLVNVLYRDIYLFTCHGQVFHSTTYQ